MARWASTEYREMGFLPEAVRNYLLRLGWGHGDDEIISTEQAIAWFDLDGVGRSPARFDLAKLLNLNAHYLRERPDAELVELIRPRLAGRAVQLDEKALRRLRLGMDGLKQRARTLVDLAESAAFYVRPRPMPVDEKARKLLDEAARAAIWLAGRAAGAVEDWREDALESVCRAQAEAIGVGFGKLAQPLRARSPARRCRPASSRSCGSWAGPRCWRGSRTRRQDAIRSAAPLRRRSPP